jgi:small-conductance mechanosensitive channel
MTSYEAARFFALLAVAALAAFAASALLRRFANRLPLRADQRHIVRRVLPLVEAMLGLIALLVVLALGLPDRPTLIVVAVALITVTAVAASWFAIRDVIAGLVLRVEGAVQPNEWIRIGELEGRVRRIGMRSVELELGQGGRATVPFTRVAPATVVRRPPESGGHAHSFTVTPPAGMPVATVVQRVHTAALNCFYSVPAREPHIAPHAAADGATRLTVTIYAPEPVLARLVERAVRLDLENSTKADPLSPAKKTGNPRP